MSPRDYTATMEDLAFLDETSVGAIEAARRTGFPSAIALEKWLTRHGHGDLWNRFRNRDPVGTHDAVNRRKARLASGTTRVCSQCDTEKPIDDFYEQTNGRDGRMACCIACNNDRPPTEARIIRQRARNRATALLVKAHAAEFEELIEQETVKARAEHAVIQAAAAGNHDATVARLRPGPRRSLEQDITDRLDVARCISCHTHHDADHECPSCGDTTPTQSAPLGQSKPWQVREWARDHGHDVPTRGPIPVAVQAAYDQHTRTQEAS